MPKTKRAYQLVTRLSQTDTERFRELALSKGLTYSCLLREAILFYLSQHNQARVNELEGIYAQQLQSFLQRLDEQQKHSSDLILKCTNRLCAMLAKIGIDGHAVYQFLARLDETAGEHMKECTGIAVKRLSRAVVQDEQTIRSGMVEQITQAN